MPDHPLGGDAIRRHLAAVADNLGDHGPMHTIVVVGGSLLALLGLRDTTLDVDVLTKIQAELEEAAREVALSEGLAPDWLNDRAKMFEPVGFGVRHCEVVARWPRLTVLRPPFDTVFLMKICAARPQDLVDLVALWPLTTFSDADAAVRAYAEAYPHEEPDPHLASFLRDLLA